VRERVVFAVAVPLVVVEPYFVVPHGPVAVPFTVVVPLPLFVVVPLAVVVPPLGPVTVPDLLVPVWLSLMLPVPDAVFPRAPVAVPLPIAVLPFWAAEPVAVPPFLPVVVFCAKAGTIRLQAASAMMRVIFKRSPYGLQAICFCGMTLRWS
jgi:hypothetical protein